VSFDAPTKAQTIEGLVRYRRKMHERHIAEALYGDANRVGEIREDLRWMTKEQILVQNSDDTYSPGRDGPSALNKNEYVKH
jgi:hypothetical protein